MKSIAGGVIMRYFVLLTVVGLQGIAGRTVLDLTHTLDGNAPRWPSKGFGIFNLTYYKSETLYADTDDDGMWVDLKKLEFFEHYGTHIDAPIHFGAGRQAIHEIPPERLIGPGINIDIREKVKRNPNYGLTVDDIHEFESTHGRIPPRAIVLINSGWAEKYHVPSLNFGTDDPSDSSSFNFPGYSLEACKMLLQERQVSVVGADGPSVDVGNVTTYHCHRFLQPNNVPLLEYVANMDSMPPTGTTVVLGVPKHRGGGGGHTRILAFIDDEDTTSGAVKTLGSAVWSVFLVVVLAILM